MSAFSVEVLALFVLSCFFLIVWASEEIAIRKNQRTLVFGGLLQFSQYRGSEYALAFGLGKTNILF